MPKSTKQRKDDERRRRKYEEHKMRKQRPVELKMVPRTVPGTTSTRTAATASTGNKGKQPKRAPSVPPPLPPPGKSANNDDNHASDDDDIGAHSEGHAHSERSVSERSRSQSPLLLVPLPSNKRKRIEAATGLSTDELEERRYKIRKTLHIMDYDVTTKLVTQSDSIDDCHDKARLVPRVVHPFINVLDVLMFGRTYREEDFNWDMEEDEDEEDESPKAKRLRELSTKKELFYEYNALLKIIPDLKTDIHIMDDEDIECLAAYIQRECGKARSTDSSHLLDHILVYYRAGSDVDCDKLPAVLEKARRGWDNYYTACALAPLNGLSMFSKNWKKWCQLIDNGKVHIVAEDWPSILFDIYDHDYEDNDSDYLTGCLRGPIFNMAVKSLLTGPISATTPGGRPEKLPGKPPLAIHYKLKAVTPRMLAYVAVLVRHLLVKGDWAVMDRDFNNHDFYDSILALFEEPLTPWASELLEWYNWEVFGNMTRKTNKKLTAGRKTMAQLVRGAAKQSAKIDKSPEQTRLPTSSPPPTDARSSDDLTEGLYSETLATEDSVMQADQAASEEAVGRREDLLDTSPAPEEAGSSSNAA